MVNILQSGGFVEKNWETKFSYTVIQDSNIPLSALQL